MWMQLPVRSNFCRVSHWQDCFSKVTLISDQHTLLTCESSVVRWRHLRRTVKPCGRNGSVQRVFIDLFMRNQTFGTTGWRCEGKKTDTCSWTFFFFFYLRAPDVHVHLNTVKHETLEARDAVMDKKSLTGDVVVLLREYFLFGSWGGGQSNLCEGVTHTVITWWAWKGKMGER